ncbi:hypothetical protein VitviT2T_028246 [Vitis vinifera]|uniref:Laccase n=1 Tax=Vitis vinifera TaxID=29760 RepID=A0ABY9DSF5_VITVI|nr:hypothetical protein VitviT2T_028246 [Vitis vinifera]
MELIKKKKILLLELLGFLILNVLTFCMAAKHIATVDWIVKETSYTRLCSTKKILTVNGLFPGPPMYMRRGDRLNINVRNKGKYNVTIHWHGVKQLRNPWSDGPNYVTQCPIKPGANFTYEIVLSNEEGTLWWHAHSDWSRATVHGALIVLPQLGKSYPFAKPHKEFPIVLASWFKGDVMEIIETALESGAEPNKSDAFTINGQPGDLYNCSKQGTFKLVVDYGKTYLLRIINSIMNEEMRLRALATKDYPVDVPQHVDTRMYITISVNTLPCDDNSCDGPNGSRVSASLNNISFVEPSIDVLQAYYKRIKHVYESDFPNEPPYYFNFTGDNLPDTLLTPDQGTKAKVLDYNSTVEIVFQGTNVQNAAENHPMHLHGYSFYLVGYGFGNFNKKTDRKKFNLVDPPEVNTIGVPTNGWAAIRFRADNPGVWFMHCHLERHSSWGMDTVLIVKNGRTRLSSMLPPPRQLNPC